MKILLILVLGAALADAYPKMLYHSRNPVEPDNANQYWPLWSKNQDSGIPDLYGVDGLNSERSREDNSDNVELPEAEDDDKLWIPNFIPKPTQAHGHDKNFLPDNVWWNQENTIIPVHHNAGYKHHGGASPTQRMYDLNDKHCIPALPKRKVLHNRNERNNYPNAGRIPVEAPEGLPLPVQYAMYSGDFIRLCGNKCDYLPLSAFRKGSFGQFDPNITPFGDIIVPL